MNVLVGEIANHDLKMITSDVAARGLDIPLITADKLLLASGLAESATEFCQRLRLPLA